MAEWNDLCALWKLLLNGLEGCGYAVQLPGFSMGIFASDSGNASAG